MNKAVFLDKDGTLIKNVHYNVDPEKIQLSDKAGPALCTLKEAGYLLVVVSNQAGVALGYFTEDQLALANHTMRNLLEREYATIDAIYYCPHYAGGTVAQYSIACDCRKPAAGMLLSAASEFNIELSESWMIGDIADDIEAGHLAGCSTILVGESIQTELSKIAEQPIKNRIPDYTAADLYDAAEIILSPFT